MGGRTLPIDTSSESRSQYYESYTIDSELLISTDEDFEGYEDDDVMIRFQDSKLLGNNIINKFNEHSAWCDEVCQWFSGSEPNGSFQKPAQMQIEDSTKTNNRLAASSTDSLTSNDSKKDVILSEEEQMISATRNDRMAKLKKHIFYNR